MLFNGQREAMGAAVAMSNSISVVYTSGDAAIVRWLSKGGVLRNRRFFFSATMKGGSGL